MHTSTQKDVIVVERKKAQIEAISIFLPCFPKLSEKKIIIMRNSVYLSKDEFNFQIYISFC